MRTVRDGMIEGGAVPAPAPSGVHCRGRGRDCAGPSRRQRRSRDKRRPGGVLQLLLRQLPGRPGRDPREVHRLRIQSDVRFHDPSEGVVEGLRRSADRRLPDPRRDADCAVDVKPESGRDRRFLWTLMREMRPPRHNCWLIHECIFVENAYAITL